MPLGMRPQRTLAKAIGDLQDVTRQGFQYQWPAHSYILKHKRLGSKTAGAYKREQIQGELKHDCPKSASHSLSSLPSEFSRKYVATMVTQDTTMPRMRKTASMKPYT